MTRKEYERRLSGYKTQIETNAFQYLEKVEVDNLKDPFRYLLEGGGKRIRPILTMIGCGLAGVDTDEAVDLALSMEILHNFTLVHDDIMDGSPIRRGRQTIHEKWDLSIGILVGDLMIGYACKLMPKYAHKRIFDIQKVFNDALIEVCIGQAYDMQFNTDTDITVDDYIKMIHKKTSFLLLASLKMGALLGDPSDELLNELERFAENLGLGFQIQDDLLDLLSENPKFGKIKGQDLIEGKKTFLIIEAKKRAQTESDKKIMEHYYKSNGISSKEIPAMIELMERLNVFKDARVLAESYFDKSYESLSKLPDNEYRSMLRYILEDIQVRTI